MANAVAKIDPSSPAAGLMRLDPQALLTMAVEKNAGIETLERLVSLATTVKAELAREAWNEAMAEFQRRCPRITKTKTAKIETARGSYGYAYAPLDEIMEQIRPLLGELGLSVSWTSRMEPSRVVVASRVAHALGHSESSGEVSMPIPDASERGGGNPAQRMGSALTYARRYSLLQILGLTPEDDDDAQAAGNGGTGSGHSPSDGEAHREPPAPRAITFPFPEEVRDKTPAECDLATLRKYLPVFQKAADDPKNKYAEKNRQLVTAIQAAIAEKSAQVEAPAAEPTLPGLRAPEPMNVNGLLEEREGLWRSMKTVADIGGVDLKAAAKAWRDRHAPGVRLQDLTNAQLARMSQDLFPTPGPAPEPSDDAIPGEAPGPDTDGDAPTAEELAAADRAIQAQDQRAELVQSITDEMNQRGLAEKSRMALQLRFLGKGANPQTVDMGKLQELLAHLRTMS